GVYDDERARVRRRSGTRGTVLRAGELVPGRRSPVAVRRLDLRGAEPGSSDVSAEHIARGPDSRVEDVRSGAANAAGGLVAGAAASSGHGHHKGSGWAARNLRRPYASGYWRRDDPARAERPGVVQGRVVARQHDGQRAGILVHVLVRRVGGAKPGRLQSRAEDRQT